MKISVCIGSSCHIKGSRQVVSKLQDFLCIHGLHDVVELGGSFCLGRCQKGVSVEVDGEFFSVSPETVESFFQEQVLVKVR